MTGPAHQHRSESSAWARLLLGGALVALAGLSFGPVFGAAGFPGPPILLLAVLVPAGVAIAWGLVTSVVTARPGGLASAAGVVAVLAAVAVVTRPGRQVASGPFRLLTSALPIEATGPELAAVSALTGLAALVAVWLALVSDAVLAPLPPALVCLVGGLALGAGTGSLPGWYPMVFLVLVAVLLVTGRLSGPALNGSALSGPGRGVRIGLLSSAGVITLVAAAAVPLQGTVLPGAGRDPSDVRDLVDLPVQPKARINPFAQYVALREGTLPLEITGTAARPFDRLRMVTLTEFDGRSWSVHADYRRAGRRLPPPPTSATAAPVRTVAMDVTVRYPDTLGWLPSPGRAQRVSVGGLGVDEQTGDVVIPDTRSTPARYRIVGAEAVPTSQALRADEPTSSSAPLAVELPPDLLEFVGAATAGVPAGFPRFSALYSKLSDPPFATDTSAEAPGGHGLFAISALLREHRGTSEQYASAFALMCRSLGWDARVVLGFRPSFEGTELTVRGEDVHAWVEVRFARLGWVSVDPTPARTVDVQRREDNAPAPSGRADDPITDAINAEQQAPPEPGSTATRSPSPARDDSLHGTALLIGLVVLALAAPIFAVPLGKAVRRSRRRHRGTPRTRALAAWREVADRLVESGLPIGRSTTTAEVVQAAVKLWAAAPPTPHPAALGALGDLADRAAFAPDDLPSDAADTAWRTSDELCRALRTRLSRPHRIRAVFDPRPLLPRSRFLTDHREPGDQRAAIRS
ncbi:MAG: transglutaminaseTgpA domain-containing protein [Pseudonocardiaceae bacterium]